MAACRSALILPALVVAAAACGGHDDARSGAPVARRAPAADERFAPLAAHEAARPARVKPKPRAASAPMAPKAVHVHRARPAREPHRVRHPAATRKPAPAPRAVPTVTVDTTTRPDGPRAEEISVASGEPFAGDGPLLATVTPNGDGYRDDATIRFRLTADADVTVTARAAARALQPLQQPTWSVQQQLTSGWHTVTWAPSRTLAPATYVVCLTVSGAGETREYGRATRDSTASRGPVVRVLGVEASFDRASYAPGQIAKLNVADDGSALAVRVVDPAASGAQPALERLDAPDVAPLQRYDWRSSRDAEDSVPVVIGDWQPGVYFAVVRDNDGRVAYAPLIVRSPQPSGRVAVVVPDHTWFAYDFRDDDGDGFADSWYAGGADVVRLRRPFTHAGLPWGFGQQTWPFLRWLRLHDVQADFLSEDDLPASGASLARTYDLIVVPSHLEYVTEAEYDALERFRDRGGDLIFLASNDLYWKVDVAGDTMRRVARWRDLGRPEAALVGAQYAGSKNGDEGPYVVGASAAARWAFAGTGLAAGNQFGSAGTEFDARVAASPRGTQVLASVQTSRHRGDMTYYELGAAKVFAPGTFFSGGVLDPVPSRLLENVWNRSDAPDLGD